MVLQIERCVLGPGQPAELNLATSHSGSAAQFCTLRPAILPALSVLAEFLERKVQAMIDAAERERSPTAPALPLVRLRVRTGGAHGGNMGATVLARAGPGCHATLSVDLKHMLPLARMRCGPTLLLL